MTATSAFFFLSFFLFIKFSHLLQYVPPSKVIEVVDGGEYTFGVEEEFDDEPLGRCYYETDIGMQGSFEILAPSRGHQRDEMHNIMTALGINGLCQIQMTKVNAAGPKKWILTPAIFIDEESNPIEQNQSKIEFSVKFYKNVAVLTNLLAVLSTKSFYNHLILPESTIVRSCHLDAKAVSMNLDVATSRSNVSSLSKEGDITKNIFSLGHGKCGFKYIHALFEDIGGLTWTLSAEDSVGNWYRGTFITRVEQDFNIHHTKKSVVLGTSVLVSCGQPLEQPFCTLYNPSGELVFTENCKYSIESFSVRDLGVWRCYSGHYLVLQDKEFTVEYVAGEVQRVIPIVEETETAVTIGCKLENYGMGAITYCKLTAPNQRLFNIRQSGATERYLTVGTDYNKALCVMEIPKPLLPFENGYWKCEIVRENDNFGGTFMNVGRAKAPEYKKHFDLVTKLEKSVNIYCEVPFSTDFCFIKSPNGTKYENQIGTQISLGRCSFNIRSVVASDNGTWICSFARETGLPNEEIDVQIHVADILQAYQLVEVDAGSTAQLLCHTGDLALAYCQFIAPNGTGFYVRKQESATNIRYYGRGLEYGHCGIALVDTQSVHNGYWTCAVSLVSDTKRSEMTARIMLTVSPIYGVNVAGIGIGVGVTAGAVLLIAAFILYLRWKRRRLHAGVDGSAEMRQSPDNISQSSSNSEFPL